VQGFRIPIGVAAGGRPAAACEISTHGVVAAATSAVGQPPAYAAENLTALAITPGLDNNVFDHPAVSSAIRSALGQVSPRTKSVTVVIPDFAVRVFVLDFDTLPTREDEALQVLRFRLRKSVPFDVEQARISYQILSEGSSRLETQWKVLAAIMPGPVLAEYESVVRSAGYEPGAVLPVSLAVLAALDSQEAVLAAHLSARTLTTSIVAGNDILLYRTVELPRDSDELAAGDANGPDLRKTEIQRSVAVAAAFFEDRLQFRPHRLVYSGNLPAREFAELLDDPAMAVGEAVARPEIGMTSAMGFHSIAGVTGALAGAN
jgi:type IV pilus assembly protein PilM